MEVVVRPVIRHSGAGLNVGGKAEANKCDLLHRESGPACMEVCPTHALVCVDRNKLEQMNIEKRRRTALAKSRHERCKSAFAVKCRGGSALVWQLARAQALRRCL